MKRKFYSVFAVVALLSLAACSEDEPAIEGEVPGGDEPGVVVPGGDDSVYPASAIVWGKDSTVVLTDHFVIPEGQALYVEEGVTVVASNTAVKPEIVALGSMYCMGTAENPITSAEINNIYNKLYKSDKKGVINVAVILPFMLQQTHPDTKASLYTEYYQGFLMAVDSLKRQGASINVYAYDSEESDATVRNILAAPQMKEMDLIIAPENDNHIKLIADFGLANDINVVNTFSLKNEEVSHNAKIFQTNIPHSYLYAEAADRFIRYLGNRKVVFLTHTGEENDKRDFIAGLKEELSRAHIAYSEIRFGNDLNLLNQDSILA